MPEALTAAERTKSPGYQLFMLALCVFALIALAVERAAPLTADGRQIIQYADFAVCVSFFADFVHSLVTAPSRWRYLRTWGWIDLLSSIPMIDVLRAGRLARILRILRVLRGFRATRMLVTSLLNRRAESAALVAALVTILVITVAGASVLHFEDVPESNIKTPEDALWWSVVTLTTVGYGDRVPVTSEGRLVGALLMAMGVGLVGTLSGLAAAWFLAPATSQSRSDIELLRLEIGELRRTLETFIQGSHGRRSSDSPAAPSGVDTGQPAV